MMTTGEDFFCETHMMAVFESCMKYSAKGRNICWTFMKISELSNLVDNTSKWVKIELIPPEFQRFFKEH